MRSGDFIYILCIFENNFYCVFDGVFHSVIIFFLSVLPASAQGLCSLSSDQSPFKQYLLFHVFFCQRKMGSIYFTRNNPSESFRFLKVILLLSNFISAIQK